MTTFNKILNPMYSAIANYSTQDDGAINAKYVIGTGSDNEGAVTDFTPIISEYKYIEATAAQTLSNAPLTKDDLGKSPQQIMLDRIYTHLKETGQILV
ncbi:hypothetical protein [Rodentibacter haemolyticus]|uniref:Uncharacterized protein n=1 Tax=Rodentibacter haemolyticus TaxID=2778911 RepID=A0ABX6UY75_9PAST|nr:hypothetical protein [Rodentibacter haemolyticus]QPB42240.1 hypothetical protein IHV77_10060 [Rodentibacter haemolyticus]